MSLGAIQLVELIVSNCIGSPGQGKSQSQGFIDELHGLCWHDAVQIENLAYWYPFPSLVMCLVGASCCFLCSKLWPRNYPGLWYQF